MKKVLSVIILLSTMILSAKGLYAATVWDFYQREVNGVTNPWGPDANPCDDEYGNSGVWQYLASDYGALFNSSVHLGVDDLYWNETYTCWSVDGSAGDRISSYASGDDTILRMFTANKEMILAFVSPVAATYQVDIFLDCWSYSSNGMQAYLYTDEEVLYSKVLDGGETDTIDVTVTLDAGEALFLRSNTNGNYYNDSLFMHSYTLTSDIDLPEQTTVPEPASILLLGSAVIGALKLRKRS